MVVDCNSGGGGDCYAWIADLIDEADAYICNHMTDYIRLTIIFGLYRSVLGFITDLVDEADERQQQPHTCSHIDHSQMPPAWNESNRYCHQEV